jgi:MFS family permease
LRHCPRHPAVRADLEHHGWLKRYRTDDGFGVPSVAFMLCTFWLIEALATLGRTKEARALMEQLHAVHAPLGLLADRTSRTRLMALSEMLRALALLLLLALIVTGNVSIAALAVIGFMAAVGTVAFSVAAPSLVPDILFAAARNLLAREVDGTAFRLLGIGASPLMPAGDADQPDLADPDAERRRARWAAMESLRQRFGEDAVRRGRGLVGKT